MSSKAPAPFISKEILEYLRQIFPDRIPTTPVSLEGMGVLVGEQRVIRHLQAQFNAQSKGVLGTP